MFARNNWIIKRLQWLTLESNELEELPQSFSSLKKLIHITLSKNSFTNVPIVLLEMKTIKFCFLNNNNIKTIEKRHLDDSRFMKHFALYENPGYEDGKSLISSYKHVVPVEQGDERILEDNSESDGENSIATSEIDTTDDSDDNQQFEEIAGLVPDLSRFVTAFN